MKAMKNAIFYSLLYCMVQVVLSKAILPASLRQDPTTNNVFYTVEVRMGVPEQVLTLVVDFEDDKIRTFKPMRIYSGTYSDLFGGTEVVIVPGEWYRLPTSTISSNSLLPRLCPSCDGSIGLRKDSHVWKVWPEISFSMGSMTLGGHNEAFEQPESCQHFELDCLTENSTLGPCPVKAVVSGRPYLVVFNGGPKTKLPKRLYTEYVRNYNIYQTSVWKPLKVHFAISGENAESIRDDGKSEEDSLMGDCAVYPHLFVDTESYMLESSSGLRYINLEPWDNEDVISLGVSAWSDTLVHIDMANEKMMLKPYIHKQHISGTRLLLFCLALFLFVRWKLTDSHLKPTNYAACKKHNISTMLYMISSVPLALYAYLSTPTRSVLRDYAMADAFVFATLMGVLLTFIACWVSYLYITTMDECFRLNLVKDIVMEHLLLVTMWLLMLERRADTMATAITFVINAMAIYNLGFFGILIVAYFLQARVTAPRQRALFTFYSIYLFPLLFSSQVVFAYYYFGKPFFQRFIFYLDTDISFQASVTVFCLVAQASFYVASLYGKKAVIGVMWDEVDKEKERAKKAQTNTAFKIR